MVSNIMKIEKLAQSKNDEYKILFAEEDIKINLKSDISIGPCEEFIEEVMKNVFLNIIKPSYNRFNVIFCSLFLVRFTDIEVPIKEDEKGSEIIDIDRLYRIVQLLGLRDAILLHPLGNELHESLINQINFENNKILASTSTATEDAINDFSYAFIRLANLFDTIENRVKTFGTDKLLGSVIGNITPEMKDNVLNFVNMLKQVGETD
jgi:hypothetical protein